MTMIMPDLRILINAVTDNDLASTKKFLEDYLASNKNQKRADVCTPLLARAVVCNAPDTAQYMIDQGAGVNAREFPEGTCLHTAVASVASDKAAMVLIENGADLTAQNETGNTPLMTAVLYGSPGAERRAPVIMRMLEKGADMNAKNKAGQSPLDMAILAKKTGEPLFLNIFENHIRARQEEIAEAAEQQKKNEYAAQEARRAREYQETLTILGKTPAPPLKLRR